MYDILYNAKKDELRVRVFILGLGWLQGKIMAFKNIGGQDNNHGVVELQMPNPTIGNADVNHFLRIESIDALEIVR